MRKSFVECHPPGEKKKSKFKTIQEGKNMSEVTLIDEIMIV